MNTDVIYEGKSMSLADAMTLAFRKSDRIPGFLSFWKESKAGLKMKRTTALERDFMDDMVQKARKGASFTRKERKRIHEVVWAIGTPTGSEPPDPETHA